MATLQPQTCCTPDRLCTEQSDQIYFQRRILVLTCILDRDGLNELHPTYFVTPLD